MFLRTTNKNTSGKCENSLCSNMNSNSHSQDSLRASLSSDTESSFDSSCSRLSRSSSINSLNSAFSNNSSSRNSTRSDLSLDSGVGSIFCSDDIRSKRSNLDEELPKAAFQESSPQSSCDASWAVLNSQEVWNSWESICLNDEDDEEKEEGLDEVILDVKVPDGRLSAEEDSIPSSRTVLRLSPLHQETNNFRIRLSTSHYAFSRGRSSTTRSTSSFYSLCAILKSQHQYVDVPCLPVRPFVYLTSQAAQADLLASWLAKVLTNSELLSNRCLHLFLQTELSMRTVEANAAGARDDQVVLPNQTNQYKTKDGFLIIVGRKYTGSRRMFRDHHETRHC